MGTTPPPNWEMGKAMLGDKIEVPNILENGRDEFGLRKVQRGGGGRNVLREGSSLQHPLPKL